MYKMQGNHHHHSAPSRSSGSVASSEYNQHPPIRTPGLPSHVEEGYSRQQQGRPAQPLVVRDIPRENGIDESNPDVVGDAHPLLDRQRPPSGVRSDLRPSLSVFKDQSGPENGTNSQTSEPPPSSPGRTRPVVAPKPPSAMDGNQNNHRQCRPTDPSKRRDRSLSPSRLVVGEGAVRRSETSSGKTTSCDSGLPGEDPEQELDSEGADSHRPLLAPNAGASPPRGGLKNYNSPQPSVGKGQVVWWLFQVFNVCFDARETWQSNIARTPGPRWPDMEQGHMAQRPREEKRTAAAVACLPCSTDLHEFESRSCYYWKS